MDGAFVPLGAYTDRHRQTQTDTHINTMTWPGLVAGPSENGGDVGKL